jgi:hypothetical protein
MKRGKLKAMPEGRYKELVTALEHAKARVRARGCRSSFANRRHARQWPRSPASAC